MQTTTVTDTRRYAKCIEVSKRVRWDIDRDVIRGRSFDFSRRFLPEGLSLTNEIGFLTSAERRLASQIQGRTYANVFGLASASSAPDPRGEPRPLLGTRPRSRRWCASPTRS
jgi:hypothetical protein